MVSNSRLLNGCFARAAALVVALVCAPAAANAAGANEVRGIDLQDSSGTLRVKVRTATRPESTAYRMSEPLRVVVELRDTTLGQARPVMAVNNGTLYEIRSEEVAAATGTLTRVVLFLDDVKDFVALPGDDGVVIDLVKGSASSGDEIASAIRSHESRPSEPGRFDPDQLSSVQGDHAYPGYLGGVARILGVDFKHRPGQADVSQIVLTSDTRVEYETTRQGDREFVIRVRGARLGTGLERAMDTSRFASAVDRVTAYQDRRRKDEVRIVIDLRESVEPRISAGGRDMEILTVEFPIPPAIAASRVEAPQAVSGSAEPAPAAPPAAPKRAESATGREKLMSGGQALDPATALAGSDGIFGRTDGLIMEGSKKTWTGRRINIDLVNADIHNVFRLISHVSKLNIISSDEVKGTVTVRLVDVPWDQALAAILQAKGLAATQFGNILRVASIETIRAEKEEAVQAQKASINLLPLSVLTIPLNYATALKASEQVKTVVTERGLVSTDERTNTVIVKDIEEGLVRARELLLALDTQTPQVRIQARIVEANTSWSRQLGIQWGGNLNFSRASGYPTGLYFPNDVGVSGGNATGILSEGGASTQQGATTFTSAPNWVVDLPSATSAGSLAIALGSLTDTIGLDVRLSAIENAGEGRVISSPAVIASTNKSATIQQGSRIPYVTSSLRGTQTQFADATLKLEVTPQITADRNVILDVEVQKNSVDFGSTVAGLPTIEIKEASTTAMVRDGETTVIGGVYSQEESINRTYVPGLGEIPILGALFKTTAKNKSRKELLVFITPTIITRSLPRQSTVDIGSDTPAGAGSR